MSEDSGIACKHPAYKDAEDMWEKCSAFIDGEDAVKDAGDKYLPKLSGQKDDAYKAYKERAIFFAAASKTCAGLLGAVFYKPPEVTLPLRIAYLETKADAHGASLSDIAVKIVKSLLEYGRVGLFVDRPAEGGQPYLVVYDGDDITNWDTSKEGKFVAIEEEIYVRDPENKYKMVEKEQYRELTFDGDGNYVVNIWQEVKTGRSDEVTWKVIESSQPTKNGAPIKDIPFACGTPDGLTFEISKPPLYDMVGVNLQHYRVSADLSLALHAICMPTPWISADIDANDPTKTFDLGVTTAWVLPPDSKVGFLELQGQGLGPVENALTRLENMLIMLGARIVTQSKVSTGVETAKGSEIRENQATEMLASILVVAESLLNWGGRLCAEWENANPDEVSIKINKDLIKSNLDANMVNALFSGYLKGTISAETLYKNLNESSFYSIDSTFESEFASIKKRMDEQAAAAAQAAKDALPSQSATQDTKTA
jgi:hypothetical protein